MFQMLFKYFSNNFQTFQNVYRYFFRYFLIVFKTCLECFSKSFFKYIAFKQFSNNFRKVLIPIFFLKVIKCFFILAIKQALLKVC